MFVMSNINPVTSLNLTHRKLANEETKSFVIKRNRRRDTKIIYRVQVTGQCCWSLCDRNSQCDFFLPGAGRSTIKPYVYKIEANECTWYIMKINVESADSNFHKRALASKHLWCYLEKRPLSVILKQCAMKSNEYLWTLCSWKWLHQQDQTLKLRFRCSITVRAR